MPAKISIKDDALFMKALCVQLVAASHAHMESGLRTLVGLQSQYELPCLLTNIGLVWFQWCGYWRADTTDHPNVASKPSPVTSAQVHRHRCDSGLWP